MLDSIACLIVKLLARIACALPTSTAVWIGERLGLLGFWISPKRVRIGVQNLRAAYDGELSPWQARTIIRKRYKSLGAGAVEMFRLPVMDKDYLDRYMKISGLEHLEKAVAQGVVIK